MKTTLSVLLILLSSILAHAQPILTGTTTNAVPGDKFYLNYCDITGVTVGAAGTGVTWNFGSLVSLSTDSIEFTACTGTPYCDTFPGSSIASFDGSDYSYYKTDASSFSFNGVGISGGSVYYSDPQDLINYPMTYNTVSVDPYFSSQPSFSYYSYGIDSLHGDAYGTLILPSGTYTDVLRVHLISHETDSDAHSAPTQYKMELYFWYKAGFHYPLLQVSLDTFGTGIPTISDAVYSTAPASAHSSVIDVNANNLNVQISPNPAKDELLIALNSSSDDVISYHISDMAGRVVIENTNKAIKKGTNSIDCNVTSLPAGIYMLHLQAGGKEVVKKVVISK